MRHGPAHEAQAATETLWFLGHGRRRASTLASRIDRLAQKHGTVEENEFLTWLRFAVPGMLAQGNVEAMEYAVAKLPPDTAVVEIGSFCGLSTAVLSYLLDHQERQAPLFSCDKWAFEGQRLGAPLGDSKEVTHDAYRAYVKDTFLRVMETFAAKRLPHTVECLSDDFFLRWFIHDEAVDVFGRQVSLGVPVGFCYIDGNHTYEFARRDFENTNRASSPGGSSCSTTLPMAVIGRSTA